MVVGKTFRNIKKKVWEMQARSWLEMGWLVHKDRNAKTTGGKSWTYSFENRI